MLGGMYWTQNKKRQGDLRNGIVAVLGAWALARSSFFIMFDLFDL